MGVGGSASDPWRNVARVDLAHGDSGCRCRVRLDAVPSLQDYTLASAPDPSLVERRWPRKCRSSLQTAQGRARGEIEDLSQDLADLFGRPVDLVSRKALHPLIRDGSLADAEPFMWRLNIFT